MWCDILAQRFVVTHLVCVHACVSPSMRARCVGGAMNGQRGVFSPRHRHGSEMSAIYSTARLPF